MDVCPGYASPVQCRRAALQPGAERSGPDRGKTLSVAMSTRKGKRKIVGCSGGSIVKTCGPVSRVYLTCSVWEGCSTTRCREIWD